jgi:hypothetical protein
MNPSPIFSDDVNEVGSAFGSLTAGGSMTLFADPDSVRVAPSIAAMFDIGTHGQLSTVLICRLAHGLENFRPVSSKAIETIGDVQLM